MLNKLLISLLVISCIGLGFYIGYTQTTYIPQVEYVETDHYIIEEVEKEVEIEVEVPIKLREFESLEELETWLANDRTDGKHYMFNWVDDEAAINLEGQTSANFYIHPDYQDCDDYARILQDNANKDGFEMSVQLDEIKHHALNTAIIGNKVYFIEPQTDDIERWENLD